MTADDLLAIGETQGRAELCERDPLYFMRYFFKQRMGSKMIVAPHHEVIMRTLQRVLSGEITRLIINISPGYSKTELCTINMMAYGLAINPRAKFLHLSYSHSLALLNSSTARGIVKSPAFQAMWPIELKDDADSKAMWWTEQGGGVYATSSAGQVTGFRAGHMEKGFTGALIIDDPVKPDDAYSEVLRGGVNNRYNETIASRLAVESVPIIVIMQRIHWDDLSGYLLRGGSGEKWHHLNLPVIIDNNDPYPEDYTHGIPIDHGLPDGWLWPVKHGPEQEVALKSHRRKFWAQYMQKPIKRDEETALWPERLIAKCQSVEVGEPTRTIVAIDPAASNSKTSDAHGIVLAKKHDCGKFSLCKDRTRHGSPSEWAKAAIALYDDSNADAIVIETNQGGDMCEDTLRNAGFNGRIIRVHASKGKVIRAEPVVALYEQGMVRHEAGLHDLEEEMMDFDPVTGLAGGKSPNRVDAAVWALTELADLSTSQPMLFMPSRYR